MDEINLNSQNDILKFSFTQLKNTKLHNFKGPYFEQLFAEAMKLEKEEKEEIIVKEIEFELNYHLDYSERLVICGNKPELGDWNPKRRFL